MSAQPVRKLFTTAEYHQMIEAGVFDEDDPIELLNGDIIVMSPIGPRHASCVDRLNLLLVQALLGQAIVRVQSSIVLDDYSEPEPDLALLKPRDDFYARSLPAAGDILAVIEVSDTTVEKDRGIKIPAYARAGIAETWLVDLFNDRIEIHSEPASGIYQETRIVLRGQPVVSKNIPQLQLNADDILG